MLLLYNSVLLQKAYYENLHCRSLAISADDICMALYSVYCAEVPLRNCSLTHLVPMNSKPEKVMIVSTHYTMLTLDEKKHI